MKQKKPVIKETFEEESEDEQQLNKFAKAATTAMFNKTKEKLTDSLL